MGSTTSGELSLRPWGGAAVAFGSLLVTELLCRTYFHDDHYYQQQGWPKLPAFLLAAAIVWLLQRNHKTEALEAANHPIEKEPILRPYDRLFLVSISYWPPILCGLGVVFYFVR